MRLRNESLRTGNLLTFFDQHDHTRNRSILFLVSGAVDIEALADLNSVWKHWISERGDAGFEWKAVADQGRLSAVDPRLDASRVLRVETREFANLERDDLRALLFPALERLVQGESELFPSASGAVGAVARGIQFLDRQDDIKRVEELIQDGHHVLITAPRRSGKTSLLWHLQERLAHEYALVFLDLQEDATPAEAAARFWTVAAGEKPRRSLRLVEQSGWKKILRDGIRRISKEAGRKVVLVLDELVYLLDNISSTQGSREADSAPALEFLTCLSESISESRVQVAIAGSFDVREYLSESLGLTGKEIPELFTNLHCYALPPLAEHNLNVELMRVLIGTGLVPEASDLKWLVENTDVAVPYPAVCFLDQLASKIRSIGPLDEHGLERELITFLDETKVFEDFKSALRRKGDQMPGVGNAAFEALDLIARRPAETGELAERIRGLLNTEVPRHSERVFAWLFETFPLRLDGDRVRFASRLWRRWWRRQEGLEE